MFEVRCEFRPTHLTLLATPVEPFPYHRHRQLIKPCDTRVVFAHAIVLKMAPQFSGKNLPPDFCLDPVSDPFKPLVHGSAFRRKLLTARLTPQLKIAVA